MTYSRISISKVVVLASLVFVGMVHGYAEGAFNLATQAEISCRSASGRLALKFAGDAMNCKRVWAETGDRQALVNIRTHVELRRPLNDTLFDDNVCLVATVRSSTSRTWWYLIPPSPAKDIRTRQCGNLSFADTGVDIDLDLKVPLGFNQISVRLDQPIDSWHCQAPDLQTVLWVSDVGALSWPDMKSELQTSFEIVHSDEASENAKWFAKARSHALRYQDLSVHKHLRLPLTGDELYNFLDPDLESALRDGSPMALWSVLRGTDHTTRCLGSEAVDAQGRVIPEQKSKCSTGVYTFPLLKSAITRDLLEELDRAKNSPMGPEFSIPNNNENSGTQVRRNRSGIILDEIGLAGFAQQLVRLVLAPIAGLLHKEWAPWYIDSYHAFTIHVGAEDYHNRTNGGLPMHLDVCEVSMNMCLGREGFKGSSVYFGDVMGLDQGAGVFAGKAADSFGTHERRLDHMPGRAFLNLCQQFHGTDALLQGERHALVVRGLSTRIRRSPGEFFFQTCMADASSRSPFAFQTAEL